MRLRLGVVTRNHILNHSRNPRSHLKRFYAWPGNMATTLASLTNEQETTIGQTLTDLLVRFGGAIEYWTMVCLTRRELGNPALFIDRQWNDLRDQLQELRAQLNDGDFEPSGAVYEQIAKLAKVCVDLRDLFDSFMNAHELSQKDLEAAVIKLAQIWQDVRMRVWLLGALIPLPSPPALSMEKEAYYQSILDGLFDRFMATRIPDDLHLRNGRPR